MTTFSLSPGTDITLGRVLAAAGEGSVYEVVGRTDWAAKVFHKDLPRLEDKLQKVLAMTTARPEGAQQNDGFTVLTWPLHVIRDEHGRITGYVMSRVDTSKAVEIHVLSNPSNRANPLPSAPQWPKRATWHHLVSVAANLCVAVDAVHRVGAVIGDFQERNVLVSDTTRVTLVDCDSMQFTGDDGREFLCSVGRPEFSAPELAGVDLGTQPRARSSDLFSLAVHIHLLLMGGNHPFLRGIWTGAGDQPAAMELARDGHWSGGWGSPLQTHPLAPPPSFLPADLRNLFLRAFTLGAHDPDMRPSAEEWRVALSRVHTVPCPAGHHDIPTGCSACPWCAIEAERARRKGGSVTAPPAAEPARVAPDPPPTVAPTPAKPVFAQRKRRRRWLAPAVATVAVGIAVAGWSVVEAFRGVYDSPVGPPAASSPSSSSAAKPKNPSSAAGQAQCDGGDETAQAGSTASRTYVICRSASTAALYYKQVRRNDGFATRSMTVTATIDAYDVAFDFRSILVRDRELLEINNGAVVSVEPILASWAG